MKSNGQPDSRALMLAAIEPGTGKVRALAVNRSYKIDDPKAPANGTHTDPAKRNQGIRGNYPNTVNPLMTGGGDIHGYQAGSTFKMFTMVAALENGYPLDYGINATSPYKSKYPVERGSPAACPGTTNYCPVNANPEWMNGQRNMWTGFGRSVNTYFIPLEERIGAEKAVEASQRLGIQYRSPSDADLAKPERAKNWGAFTLGVSQTTPLDVANAYATLAADGKYCEPIPVEEIRDHMGNKLDVGNPRCRQAVRTEVARAAVDAARCPVNDQSATGNRCNGATYNEGRGIVGQAGRYQVAGKTGTTDGDKTAALVMMTKQLAVAGIAADPDTPQSPPQAFKAEWVNPAVAKTLRDGMRGKPAVPFAAPGQQQALGQQVNIPTVTCQPEAAARATIQRAGFKVEVSQTRVPSACPAGTVASTEPSGRTVRSGTVTLVLSSGPTSAGQSGRNGGGDDNRGRNNGGPRGGGNGGD
jgi:membrane peptidoglycan carboxypeptidase